MKMNPYAHPNLHLYWCHTDGGRSTSQRGRSIRNVQKLESKDCTVRATSGAFGMSYDDAHKFLETELNRERNSGSDLNKVLNSASKKGTKVFGKYVKWVSLPPVAGQRRTDIYALMSSGALKGKNAIIREAHHVYAVVNGIAHDTVMPYSGRCVYGYWLIG